MNQRKVLVVGLDGLRHDRIFQVATPNLRRLIRTGAYGTGLLPYFPPVSRTDSGPGWSSIATGVWPPKHGVVDNHFKGADYATYPDFLTRAARAGKAPMRSCPGPSSASTAPSARRSARRSSTTEK